MPPRATSSLKACKWQINGCPGTYLSRGVKNHERTCPFRSENIIQADPGLDLDVSGANALLVAAGVIAPFGLQSPTEDNPEAGEAIQDANIGEVEQHFNDESPPSPRNENRQLQLDDIKITTHPSCNRSDVILSFEDYSSYNESDIENNPQNLQDQAEDRPTRINDKYPCWHPFRTRLDFEIAELMHAAQMKERLGADLISLIQQASGDNLSSDFTFSGYTDLKKVWDHAREIRTSMFVKHTVEIDYKDEVLSYDVWIRPLWSWCEELLLDPELIKEFRWDAEKLYKYDGENWVRFIDEPWTANSWWAFQTAIPGSAKGFYIIIYADKTKLSSFGTEKGYPVLARCANLPVLIRNGEGVGGGRLVGWLPIPEELASETHKPHFVNHKREIWHDCVAKIFESIDTFTRLGVSLKCGDGVVRTIFPRILIISADFEEQSMMALTRGPTASYPCTVCLVPKSEIPNLSITYPLRTTQTMRAIYDDAQTLNATEREVLLQSHGLRDVQNVFWTLQDTDVYSAISWDRLHAYHGGLFSDHLLDEFKKTVGSLGRQSREVAVAIDEGLQKMPHWPGLNTFKSLASTGEFADGTKFEDFSKVILFAAHHALTSDVSPDGYILLKLIRSYLELDMFASLTVQTELTIAAGEAELLRFEEVLHEYEAVNPLKTWNFPKAHTHKHVFQDILNKGVTRNYNTKPNEKANGPLKKFYNRTNFKNVAPQILKFSEMDLVSTIIRTDIDALDERAQIQAQNAADAQEDGNNFQREGQANSDETTNESKTTFGYITLGSQCQAVKLEELETQHAEDDAYLGLRTKANTAITKSMGSRRRLILSSDEQIVTPFRFLKVRYGSEVDWRWKTDILRANPLFHGKERYDFALIKVGAENSNEGIFVQILQIFTLQFRGDRLAMALVLPLDIPKLMVNRPRDDALRFTRVQARPRAATVIIDTRSIIRGGLLVRDFGSPGNEYLVIEFIDEDMWSRLKNINLATNTRL